MSTIAPVKPLQPPNGGLGPDWAPPSCTTTTIALTPWLRRVRISEFTVCASSLKVSPATPDGETMLGVPSSVMPMKAMRTPPKVLMT